MAPKKKTAGKKRAAPKTDQERANESYENQPPPLENTPAQKTAKPNPLMSALQLMGFKPIAFAAAAAAAASVDRAAPIRVKREPNDNVADEKNKPNGDGDDEAASLSWEEHAKTLPIKREPTTTTAASVVQRAAAAAAAAVDTTEPAQVAPAPAAAASAAGSGTGAHSAAAIAAAALATEAKLAGSASVKVVTGVAPVPAAAVRGVRAINQLLLSVQPIEAMLRHGRYVRASAAEVSDPFLELCRSLGKLVIQMPRDIEEQKRYVDYIKHKPVSKDAVFKIVPMYGATFESSLLIEHGSRPSRRVPNMTVDAPACTAGTLCVAMKGGIPGFFKPQNVEYNDHTRRMGTGAILMSWMSPEELEMFETRGIAPTARLCLICMRSDVQSLAIKCSNQPNVLPHGCILQPFGNLTNQRDGYREEFCTWPSSRTGQRYNGLVERIVNFQDRDYEAVWNEALGKRQILQTKIIYTTADENASGFESAAHEETPSVAALAVGSHHTRASVFPK